MGTTACVFSSKYKKKMTWEHRVFVRMDGFLQNMGMRAVFFHEKSEKRVPYWLIWPIIYSIFARFDVFLTKYGHENRGFFKNKLKKKYMNIWENRRLLTKYGYKNSVFFENVPTFSTKYWQNLRFFDHIWAWLEGVFHEFFF